MKSDLDRKVPPKPLDPIPEERRRLTTFRLDYVLNLKHLKSLSLLKMPLICDDIKCIQEKRPRPDTVISFDHFAHYIHSGLHEFWGKDEETPTGSKKLHTDIHQIIEQMHDRYSNEFASQSQNGELTSSNSELAIKYAGSKNF